MALSRSKDGSSDVEKELRETKSELKAAQESQQIMQSEHKILSDELTSKMKEVQGLEKKRIEAERELLELRPLKSRLS